VYGDISPTMLIAHSNRQWYDLLDHMAHQHQSEELTRDIEGRQRNIVFPDTARNLGGFWGGLYRQRLSVFQWIGLIVLFVFYILWGFFTFARHWPRTPVTLWEILNGYSIYLLFVVPLVLFFLLLRRSLRRRK
jgi:hypothetical protein